MIIDAKYKSLFYLPATGLLALLAVLSLVAAVLVPHGQTAWLGAAIAALPLPLLFLQLRYRPPARTSDNLPFLLLIAGVGLLVAGWEQFLERASGWAPTLVALGAASLFVAYVFWFSRFGRFDNMRLAVGSPLPEFTLEAIDGTQFDSASLRGAPAVILFYRGNWCPLCVAQIGEMASRHADLDKLGIRVVLISPQPEERTRQLATRFGVPFTYLVDRDNRVADELGISIRNGVPLGMAGGYAPDTVLPTLVVCNERGTILFSDQTDNYRVRPEPDVFLAILRRSGVVAA